MKTKKGTYTVREAAERCGFRRPNTFREKFLASPEAREDLGAHYDHLGRLVVDREAVEQLVKKVEEERKRQGNWRVKNLGDHAQPRRRPQESAADTPADK